MIGLTITKLNFLVMENSKYTELEKIILGELKLLEQSLNDFNGSSNIVELDQQLIGRLSRMDSIRDQQMTKANMIRRGQRKSELIKALKRLEDDDFGFCIDCGDEIDIRRIRVNPLVRKCISCMQT